MLEVKYSKVIKRKDGRYSAYAWVDGSQRKYAYGKTTSECKRNLSDIIVNLEKGIITNNMTFSNFTIQWLNTRCANLSPSTLSGYNSYLKTCILPALGDKMIHKITHDNCQALISEFNKTHAKKSVKNVAGILHEIFEYAKSNQIIAINPAEGLYIAPTPDYEYYIYSTEEMQTLLNAVKGTDDEVPIMLAAFCGLRLSEIMGLRWSDIDFENGTLQIRQVMLSRTSNTIIKEVPKTKSSARPITVPSPVLNVLKQKNKNGVGLVVGKNGGYYSCHFSRLIKSLGLPHTRFHDLRHFVATSLMDAGLPDKAISEYLRHSDTNITRRYEHIRAQKKTQASDTMTTLLAGVNSGVNSNKKLV